VLSCQCLKDLPRVVLFQSVMLFDCAGVYYERVRRRAIYLRARRAVIYGARKPTTIKDNVQLKRTHIYLNHFTSHYWVLVISY
jgi:hypothetical protein